MLTMRSATEFFAEGFNRHHAYLLAILIAEEGQRPLGDRILNAHDLRRDLFISSNLVVHASIQSSSMSRDDSGLKWAKSKPQPVRTNQ